MAAKKMMPKMKMPKEGTKYLALALLVLAVAIGAIMWMNSSRVAAAEPNPITVRGATAAGPANFESAGLNTKNPLPPEERLKPTVTTPQGLYK